MSPEAKRSFEDEWAVLSRRLRLLLIRKHVPPGQHDDLLQETALRLVSMWDSVDRRRELWPLTATIALNLVRDRGRIVHRDDLVGDMPELRALTDVETAGIARMELAKVREAMNQLSASHRSILMKEIGGHTGAALPDGAADKMLRMRARRKLRSAMEKVSGLVALRARRLGDLFESLVVLRETGMTAASCAFCLALGVGGTMLAPSILIPEASARPVQGAADSSTVLAAPQSTSIAASDTEARRAIAEARATSAAARDADAGGQEPSARRGKDREAAVKPASNSGLLGDLPVGDGGDDATSPPSISLDAQSDQPAPAGGGGDAPEVPPAPDPPAPPPIPGSGDEDSGQDPVGEVTELAEELL